MVLRRGPDEVEKMRCAGRVVAEMHAVCRDAIRPGVTTGQLDRLARDVLDRRGARSNFLGYHGFPAVVCASVNDEVVHGIPGSRRLEEGDIVSIDCGAIVDGRHGDAAFTMGVGTLSESDAALIETRRWALEAAIEVMVVAGDPAVETLADRWTVVTRDGGRAVYWEHTIALTADGPQVLTQP